MILKCRPVYCVNLFLRTDALVESLSRLLADPFPVQHFFQHRRRQETLAPRIVRHQGVKVVRDECPNIQADDIQQPETRALRNPDEWTGQQVDFLDGVISLELRFVDGRSEKAADAVRDEIWRIFAQHDALPEPSIAEIRSEANYVRIGVRARDNFGKVQVSRRVEEVRAQEIA